MGGEVSELVFAKSGPTVILLAGLQGVGKTTVCAKLAFHLKKLGKSSVLVAGDVYRPAAIDQLVILGEQIGVPVYTAGTEVKPSEIARQGLEEAEKKGLDVVIFDTAGRLQIDREMMDELKDVKWVLNPTEVLLVVDAMTGQEAAALVTTFNVEIGITGAILAKLDGDSRGGAALSVIEVKRMQEDISERLEKQDGRSSRRLGRLPVRPPDRKAYRKLVGRGPVAGSGITSGAEARLEVERGSGITSGAEARPDDRARIRHHLRSRGEAGGKHEGPAGPPDRRRDHRPLALRTRNSIRQDLRTGGVTGGPAERSF